MRVLVSTHSTTIFIIYFKHTISYLLDGLSQLYLHSPLVLSPVCFVWCCLSYVDELPHLIQYLVLLHWSLRLHLLSLSRDASVQHLRRNVSNARPLQPHQAVLGTAEPLPQIDHLLNHLVGRNYSQEEHQRECSSLLYSCPPSSHSS